MHVYADVSFFTFVVTCFTFCIYLSFFITSLYLLPFLQRKQYFKYNIADNMKQKSA
jgi:hypothetical protein